MIRLPARAFESVVGKNLDSKALGFLPVICRAIQPLACPLKINPAALSRRGRDPEYCGHRNSTTTCSFSVEFCTSRAIPALRQNQIDKGERSTADYLGRHHALFTLRKCGTKEWVPVPTHGSNGCPSRATDSDRSLENEPYPFPCCGFTSVAIGPQAAERHYVARRNTFGASRANFCVSFQHQKIRGTLRAGNQHRRMWKTRADSA